jgi:hypothetical protein
VWSSDNPNGLVINPSTGVATRVNNFNGQATVFANIGGVCAQVSKTVLVGNPSANIHTLIYPNGQRGVNPVTLCSGCVYNFRVDFIPGNNSYNWIVPSGFTISGGNTAYPVIIASQTPGTYSIHCAVTNFCGTSWTKSLSVIVSSGSGGGGHQQIITIYPNPTDDELNIEQLYQDTELYVDKAEFDVILINGNQTKIAEARSKDSKVCINTKNLPQGYYFAQIRFANDVFVHRVQIKRN